LLPIKGRSAWKRLGWGLGVNKKVINALKCCNLFDIDSVIVITTIKFCRR